MKNKQLKRSNQNKILFGVVGGVAEYFEMDKVLARLIFVVLLVLTGFFPFGLIYILAVIIIPEDFPGLNHEAK